MKLRLRTEIIINVAVLAIATFGLVVFIVVKVMERDMLSQKYRSAEAFVKSLQVNLTVFKDKLTPDRVRGRDVQSLAEFSAAEVGLDYLSIFDRNMVIAAASQPGMIGKFEPDRGAKDALDFKTIVTTYPKAGRFPSLGAIKSFEISAPIISGGEAVGGVRAVFNLDELRQVVPATQKLLAIYIALACAILVVFISWLLSRSVVAPLAKLVEATDAASKGDFSRRIEPAGALEIASLAESFNSMAESLEGNRSRIEEQLLNLEEANDQLRAVREEVLRSEKLASVGRLAAGVAHELGNPVSAIMGYSEMMMNDGSLKERERDVSRRIWEDTNRINRIVQDLLGFARPRKPAIERADLRAVAGAAVSMLKEQGTLKGIEVREEMPGELPVSIDRSQMEQVMVNILLNARDAMPDGGEILVRGGETEYKAVPAAAGLRRRSDDPPGIDFSRKRKGISIEGMEPFKDGEMIVKLSVADNGSGIKPENIERIFDPFFTTKEPGKGTGLGLTVCQRIIESFGGKIVVESVEGEGSRVTLMLPKAT